MHFAGMDAPSGMLFEVDGVVAEVILFEAPLDGDGDLLEEHLSNF